MEQKIRNMTTITPLEKLTSPLGGQVIELQQLDLSLIHISEPTRPY